MKCFINLNKYTLECLRLKYSSERHKIIHQDNTVRLISFFITPNERFIVQIMTSIYSNNYIIKLYEKHDNQYIFLQNLCKIFKQDLPYINIHITKLDIDLNWIEISNTCLKRPTYIKSCYFNLHSGELINRNQIIMFDSDNNDTFYKQNNITLSKRFQIDYDPLYYEALTTYHKIIKKIANDYTNIKHQNNLNSILCKISFYKHYLYICDSNTKEVYDTIILDNCIILSFNVTNNGYAILFKNALNASESIYIF